MAVNDLKRDLRQVSLSDSGRRVLLDALRRNFPNFPNGVLPYKWKEVTQADRRTVDRMLETGRTVRYSSVVTIFADLAVELDEEQHLDFTVQSDEASHQDEPSESKPLNGNGSTVSSNAQSVASFRPPGKRIFVWIAVLILAGAGFIAWRSYQRQSAPIAVLPVNPDTEGTRSIVLYDDFRREDALDTAMWTLNGPAARSALTNLTATPAKVVEPKFTLDQDQGLGIAGVNGNNQEGGLQSTASFSPPFTVTAQVMDDTTHAAPLQIIIANDSGSSGLALIGQQGVAVNDTGFITMGPPSTGRTWQEIANLSPIAPDDDVWYTFAISVNSKGTATVAVSSGDQVLGEGTAIVGPGPFHLILAQGAGAQATPGPNQSYCAAIQVVNGTAE